MTYRMLCTRSSETESESKIEPLSKHNAHHDRRSHSGDRWQQKTRTVGELRGTYSKRPRMQNMFIQPFVMRDARTDAVDFADGQRPRSARGARPPSIDRFPSQKNLLCKLIEPDAAASSHNQRCAKCTASLGPNSAQERWKRRGVIGTDSATAGNENTEWRLCVPSRGSLATTLFGRSFGGRKRYFLIPRKRSVVDWLFNPNAWRFDPQKSVNGTL